jgi:hypothetical protein
MTAGESDRGPGRGRNDLDGGGGKTTKEWGVEGALQNGTLDYT